MCVCVCVCVCVCTFTGLCVDTYELCVCVYVCAKPVETLSQIGSVSCTNQTSFQVPDERVTRLAWNSINIECVRVHVRMEIVKMLCKKQKQSLYLTNASDS